MTSGLHLDQCDVCCRWRTSPTSSTECSRRVSMTPFGRGDRRKKSGGSGSASASSGRLQIVDRQGIWTTEHSSAHVSGSGSESSNSPPIRSKDHPQARLTDSDSVCPSTAKKSPRLRTKRQQPSESRSTDSPPRRNFVSTGDLPRASPFTSRGSQSVRQSDRGSLPIREGAQDPSTRVCGGHAQPADEADLRRTLPLLPTLGSPVGSIPIVVQTPVYPPISSSSQPSLPLRRPTTNLADKPGSLASSSRGSFHSGPSRTSSTGQSYGHQALIDHSTGLSCGPQLNVGRSTSWPFARLPRPPVRKIRLGIEMEFLLAARSEEYERPYVDDFVELLAQNYNSQISKIHPEMVEYFMSDREENDYRKWSVVEEWTIGTQDSPCKSPPGGMMPELGAGSQ